MTEWVTRRFGVLRVPPDPRTSLSDEELQSLLPRCKQDIERVEVLLGFAYPAIEPILPELLIWLQDMNWPIAEPLSLLMASAGEPVVPHIRKVLEGSDEIWKTNVLTCFRDVPEVIQPLSDLIARIALRPTPGEIEEETDQAAREALESLLDEGLP